jgi:hypothetical protein
LLLSSSLLLLLLLQCIRHHIIWQWSRKKVSLLYSFGTNDCSKLFCCHVHSWPYWMSGQGKICTLLSCFSWHKCGLCEDPQITAVYVPHVMSI